MEDTEQKNYLSDRLCHLCGHPLGWGSDGAGEDRDLHPDIHFEFWACCHCGAEYEIMVFDSDDARRWYNEDGL